MVPKIIHKLAPEKEKWNPLWHQCDESWKKHFPENEYVYKYYNDTDIDNYVKEHFPQYLDFYNNLPFHIIKIDFVRFCILYREGGIYADLDYYVYKNFYEDLSNPFMAGKGRDCWILEAYFNLQEVKDEEVQNSLMISTPWQIFWLRCIEDSIEEFYSYNGNYNPSNVDCPESNKMVKDIAGPRFLSKCAKNYPWLVKRLNREYFNPHFLAYNESMRGKHMMTGQWGAEIHEIKKIAYEKAKESNPELTLEQFYEKDYSSHRFEFDLYKHTAEYLK